MTTSADKIVWRGDRIVPMKFDEAAPQAGFAFPVGGKPARAAMSG